MATIEIPLQITVLLVQLDVPSAQEEAILSAQAAPLAITCNPLRLPVQILAQTATIKIPLQITVLLVLLDVLSAQEEAILSAQAAPPDITCNPLRLPA